MRGLGAGQACRRRLPTPADMRVGVEDGPLALYWAEDFGPQMELRGLFLGSVPNPKDFGYLNPQIRESKLKTEPETRKLETRGYPPRTRPTAMHSCGCAASLYSLPRHR